MEILVTGATGLIGNPIARRLAEQGHAVRALVRSPERARALLPESVRLVHGDVTAPDGLREALAGVERVFHAAGMPEQWQADPTVFDRVNRQGTVNVLEAALEAKVARVIYTSTMDVFAAPPGGTLREDRIDEAPKPTAYERSKQEAEREAEAIRGRGLDVVFVNPAAVYGPSPVHVGLNSMFVQLLNRKVPLLPPGGMSVLFVDGCTEGHLAAAEQGRTGERYLLADGHVSTREIATVIAREAGLGRVPPEGPAWLLDLVARASAPLARRFRFTPLIAPGQLSFLRWDVRVDASKAERELGFQATPFEEGAARTIAFLRDEGLVPPEA
jgi:dihydroflavonol-4-reductase